MNKLVRGIDAVLDAFARLGESALAALIHADAWLRMQSSAMGLPAALHIVMLALAGLLLVVVAVQFFAGMIRAVVIVLLMAIALHMVLVMALPRP